MALIPDARALRAELAAREADKAAAEERKRATEQEAHERWIESLRNPKIAPGVDARLARRIAIAVADGKMELEALRFPKDLTSDNARAINQAEEGWERTLTGLPKLAYEYWYANLRDRGYKLRAEVITYPDGMPGDCALFLSWGE